MNGEDGCRLRRSGGRDGMQHVLRSATNLRASGKGPLGPWATILRAIRNSDLRILFLCDADGALPNVTDVTQQAQSLPMLRWIKMARRPPYLCDTRHGRDRSRRRQFGTESQADIVRCRLAKIRVAKEQSTMRRSLDDPSEVVSNVSANAATGHSAIAEATAPAQRGAPRRAALKCQSCSVRHLCLSDALSGVELRALEWMVGAPLGVAEGQTIYTAGSPFEALYIVRTATVVTAGIDRAGCQQILGYHGMGEIIGADGIATGAHSCSTLVTHAGEVCRVPFDELQELAKTSPTLQRSLIRVLGRSLQSYHSRSLYLGRVSAQQRLVSFLLDLSRQQQMVGSACYHSVLYLSRVQLSSYLGIRRETLSRVVTQLRRGGVLELAGPFVKLRNGLPLQQLIAMVSEVGERG